VPELNRRQFYHGTTARFEIGDELRPGSTVGDTYHSGTAEGDEGRDADSVFMADNEQDAWSFALNRQGGPFGPQQRPFVYTVEPTTDVVSRQQEEMPHSSAEYLAGGARVTGREAVPAPNTIMLGDDADRLDAAVQPTLPDYDEPAFAHAFMDNFSADRLAGPSLEESDLQRGAESFRAQEQERRYRRDTAPGSGGPEHHQLFDASKYTDFDQMRRRARG